MSFVFLRFNRQRITINIRNLYMVGSSPTFSFFVSHQLSLAQRKLTFFNNANSKNFKFVFLKFQNSNNKDVLIVNDCIKLFFKKKNFSWVIATRNYSVLQSSKHKLTSKIRPSSQKDAIKITCVQVFYSGPSILHLIQSDKVVINFAHLCQKNFGSNM